MSDNGTEGMSRLDALHFTRRVVERQATEQLAQLDRWIAEEQRREDAQRHAAQRRPEPPPWVIARDISGQPRAVHRGGAWCVEEGSSRVAGITRDEARRALAEGVAACDVCRPDTDLGFTG